MAEVVHYGDAAGNAAHFHSPLDAFERVEGGLNLAVLKSAMLGARHDCEGIAHVELAQQAHAKLEAGNLKLRGRRRQLEIESVNAIVLAQSKALHGAMRHVEQRRDVRIVAIGEKLAVARNDIDEPLERRLDRGKILEDIGMVKLNIINNDNLREVMDKLAALV